MAYEDNFGVLKSRYGNHQLVAAYQSQLKARAKGILYISM
jgi:hypothetical protein